MRFFLYCTILCSLALVPRAAARQLHLSFVSLRQQNSLIPDQTCTPVFDVATRVKNIAAATVLCTLAFVSPITPQPANAVAPPLEAAIIESSDATYPILKTLKPETVSPVFNAIVKILETKVPPDRFVNFLDKGIDVILSIPDNDLASFTTSVKDAYGDLTPSTCDLVPLPVAAADKFASSESLAKVDQVKIKALNEKLDATLSAFPKKGGDAAAVCLPDEKNLEKIFIAQTELSLKLNRIALQEFGVAGASVGKSIPPGELFRLLPEFQKTERGVDAKARNRFEKAGKTLDTAIKRDASFARLNGKI